MARVPNMDPALTQVVSLVISNQHCIQRAFPLFLAQKLKGAYSMAYILPDTDPYNNFDALSSFCHNNNHTSHLELYTLLQEGLNDLSIGNSRPFTEALATLKSRRKK